jgi:NAD+ kinase
MFKAKIKILFKMNGKRKIKILVFSRRTTYEMAMGEGNCKLAELIRKKHFLVRGIITAHLEHQKTLREVEEILPSFGFEFRIVYDFSGTAPGDYDIVITLGGDGTVLYASRYLDDTPLLSINSSPSTSAGYLTSITRKELPQTLKMLVEGKLSRNVLHRLAVKIDGRVVDKRVLNDILFTAPIPAQASRYILVVGNKMEEQLSSGIWIGPPAGSTAAIKAAGGKIMSWKAKKFQFVVREPVEKKGKPCRLKKGIMGPDEKLIIINTWQQSRIFLDGPHRMFEINPAQKVSVYISDSPLILLGWKRVSGR